MRFFKFQPINKFSLQGLANQSFFYAKPAVFNDPFEFELHADVCSDEYLLSIRCEDGTEPSMSPLERRSKLKNDIQPQVADFGVVSFSERDDSPLMWGHYANNHEGMCLEFEVTEHEGSVFPVSYSDELAILDDPAAPLWHKNNMMKSLVTKHIDWSYEREHRILQTNGGRCHPYPDEFGLVSVAFGVRTPQEDIDLVQHILTAKDVVFRQAIRDQNRPKILFVPYDEFVKADFRK